MRLQDVLRRLLAFAMIFAGVSHFTATATFLAMMPPLLPAPRALVYISGAAEIALGISLMIPSLRRLASLGLIALFIAVFPANVYMAIAHLPLGDLHVPTWALWARLPLQGVLIGWAYWVGRTPAPPTTGGDASDAR